MMPRERAIAILTVATSLLALSALVVNNLSSSSPWTETDPNNFKKLSRNLEAYRNDNFPTSSFLKPTPFTPEETIGRTSFRIFDKKTHVMRKFKLPIHDEVIRQKENTLDFIIAGFPKCGE